MIVHKTIYFIEEFFEVYSRCLGLSCLGVSIFFQMFLGKLNANCNLQLCLNKVITEQVFFSTTSGVRTRNGSSMFNELILRLFFAGSIIELPVIVSVLAPPIKTACTMFKPEPFDFDLLSLLKYFFTLSALLAGIGICSPLKTLALEFDLNEFDLEFRSGVRLIEHLNSYDTFENVESLREWSTES